MNITILKIWYEEERGNIVNRQSINQDLRSFKITILIYDGVASHE